MHSSPRPRAYPSERLNKTYRIGDTIRHSTIGAAVLIGFALADIVTTIIGFGLGGVERNPFYAAQFAENGLLIGFGLYLIFWGGIGLTMKLTVDILPRRFNAVVYFASVPVWAYIGWFAVANNLTTIFLLMS